MAAWAAWVVWAAWAVWTCNDANRTGRGVVAQGLVYEKVHVTPSRLAAIPFCLVMVDSSKSKNLLLPGLASQRHRQNRMTLEGQNRSSTKKSPAKAGLFCWSVAASYALSPDWRHPIRLIGVEKDACPPLPPNRTCGFPAYGSPVSGSSIVIGSLHKISCVR